MGEVPVLKKTYDAFHAKGFEIYGVSFDTERGQWLEAIGTNGMNWIHVSDLGAFDNQAAKDYAVQGIPTNFLIDAQGLVPGAALGALGLYVSDESISSFQPMNINFGIITPLDHRVKGKRNKNQEISARSLAIIDQLRERVL